MKTPIIVIFCLCFLLPTILFGQAENKKPPLSYVEQMKKKKANLSAPASYVNSRKKSEVVLEKIIPSSSSSYVDQMKKKNNISVPIPNNNSSYVSSNKKNDVTPKKIIIRSSSSYVDQMKKKKAEEKDSMVVSPKKIPQKEASRVIVVSRPKNNIPAINISFDANDYRSMANWAEREGKIIQARQIMEKYGVQIKALSLEFGLDYRLIVAICTRESGGNSQASNGGTHGLMQLKPSTAATYGVHGSAIFDPYQNLRAGVHYFSDMLKMFGNAKDAIYAYGTGHNKARRHFNKGIISERDTLVQQVLYLTAVQ